MNRKWSTATLVATAAVALGLGFFITKTTTFAPVIDAKAHSQTKAVINLNSRDKSCQQYAGSNFGHVVKYAFPVLSKGGDSIVWHGRVDGGSPNAKVVVQFPSGHSPFAKDKFEEDQDSGPVGASVEPGDYPFSTASVDGTPCSSFTDPGVHVDR